MVLNGFEVFIVFDFVNKIIFFVFFFDNSISLMGKDLDFFMIFLFIVIGFNNSYDDVFGGYEREFLRDLMINDLGVDNEVFRDIL